MTVRCPGCKLKMLWTALPVKVLVRCPNREVTSWIGDPPRHQHGQASYGSTTSTGCWHETFWVDGEDRVPRWWCRKTFAVRAA